MKLRFACWNVNNRNPTRRHIEILRDACPDILALQEVCPALHDALAAEDVFAWDAFSLKLRPPRKGDGRSRRLGCSLFGTARSRLRSCSLVPRLVLPERTLVATVEADGGVVTVCSFHTPPGASWGEVKPRTLKAIAQWLQRQPPPLIFGIDANCPKKTTRTFSATSGGGMTSHSFSVERDSINCKMSFASIWRTTRRNSPGFWQRARTD